MKFSIANQYFQVPNVFYSVISFVDLSTVFLQSDQHLTSRKSEAYQRRKRMDWKLIKNQIKSDRTAVSIRDANRTWILTGRYKELEGKLFQRSKRWTNEEDEKLKNLCASSEKKNYKKIAHAMNRSENAVNCRWRTLQSQVRLFVLRSLTFLLPFQPISWGLNWYILES